MPINIPESVFQKYYDVIDSTITDIFGVDCELVFIEKVEEIVDNPDNYPENKTINPNRRRNDVQKRGNKVIREVERRENIKLKVYWDSKDWRKVGGGVVLPDTAVQTIFFDKDLHRVMSAKYLCVHNAIKDVHEYKFSKLGEPWPMGLRHYKYYGCFWERA
tara:strand:+ start:140 stop:622 length:483 start_codon:yes stop_codon:yes gene_type:complete